VQQKPSTITGNLVDTPNDHADHKVPRLPSEALDDVDDHRYAKQGDGDSVDGNVGPVLEDAPFYRAYLDGAIGVGAEGDEAVGEGLGHCSVSM